MTSNWRELDLLLPPETAGSTVDCDWSEMQWINDLGVDVFAALFLRWPSAQGYQMPQGHDLYIVSFNLEPFDVDWIMQEAARHGAPIIVLNEGHCYNFPLPANVHFFPFVTWHLQMDRILHFHPGIQKRSQSPRYLASAVCNRLTQSKIVIFSALKSYLGSDQCLVKLGTWLEPKNVHFWQPTGVAELDNLVAYFQTHWLGHRIEMDAWDDRTCNNERTNSDPWQSFYLDSALHFTNESYHYSHMQDQWGSATRPGPNLSEKTMKCLIAACPFVPVGQHDTYGVLARLGFCFDYGELDLSWDQYAGNIERLLGIVTLIKTLTQYTADDITDMTKQSSMANQDHIFSGTLGKMCRHENEHTVAEIFSRFGAKH
jgi:hypothetical protein